jgi:hypothetical protein
MAEDVKQVPKQENPPQVKKEIVPASQGTPDSQPRRRRFAEEQPGTKKYTLAEGKKHVHEGVTLKPGDTVELTDAQYRAFYDKFEARKAPPAPAVVQPVETARILQEGMQDRGSENLDLTQTTNPGNRVAMIPGKPLKV